MTHVGSLGFSKAFKELFVVYAFDLIGLVAGFLIAFQLGVFRVAPWVLALFPAVLGAKSVIDGLLSGRLITTLHLGTVNTRFFQNTKSFYVLVEAIALLTLLLSLAISVFSLLFGQVLWGVQFADFPAILAVVAGTMSLGLGFLVVIIKVSFFSFQRAYDPDTTVYPITSTFSSIFITFCFVLAVNLFFSFGNIGIGVLSLFGFINLVIALYSLIKNKQHKEFKEIVKESLASLLAVALIVNLTGAIFKGIDRFFGSTTRFSISVIYTVYPAFLGIVSDVSSVIGSLATTKLALGMLRPDISSIINHIKNVLSTWFVSMIMFILSGLVALIMNGRLSIIAYSEIIPLMALTNIISVASIILLSHSLSILVFKKGIDPSNFVLPIQNTLAASITSFALLASLVLFGAG